MARAIGWSLEVALHSPKGGVKPHPTEPSEQAFNEAKVFIERHLPPEIGLPVSVFIVKPMETKNGV